MNQLALTRDLKLSYIIPQHQKLFEQHVINLYMEDATASRKGLPEVRDIMSGDHPCFFAAMIQADITGNPSFYIDQTATMTHDKESEYAFDVIDDVTSEYDMNEFNHCYMEDVTSVLDYHHMSFLDVMDNGFRYYSFDNNLPITGVW